MDSSGNQWETVTFDKRGPRSGQSSKTTMMKAQRAGQVSVQAKCECAAQRPSVGVGNKGGTGGADRSKQKIDEETEQFKHNKVDKAFSKALMQARLAKKMNQKQLATPVVINQYESGKAIPNQAVVAKLSRALGVRLPSATGKKKGGGGAKKK
eukprot:g2535.t1